MNPRLDRRRIAPMLVPYFPKMAAASSDEWHIFLNAQTKLDIPFDALNGTAFDEWRQALAGQGFPVWGHVNEKGEYLPYTPEALAAMRAAAAQMVTKADVDKALEEAEKRRKDKKKP